MREFAGVRLDVDYTEDAAVTSVNIDYTMEGELRRRTGMAYAQAQSGLAIAPFQSTTLGAQVVFATSSGTIVTLDAT